MKHPPDGCRRRRTRNIGRSQITQPPDHKLMTGCLLRKDSGAWRSAGMYNVRQDRYVKPKVHDASSSEKVVLALKSSGHTLYVSRILACYVNCCLVIASNGARVRSAPKGPPVGGNTYPDATIHVPRSSSGQVRRKITALRRG